MEGISIILGSSVEVRLFSISGGKDDSQVLVVGEGLLFVNLKGVLRSDLLGVAAVELVGGVSKDVLGISDLLSSEFVLGGAFSGLGVIDLVVVDLFSVNGISEFGEDVQDGIKG